MWKVPAANRTSSRGSPLNICSAECEPPHRYSFFDFSIASDIPLPELPGIEDASPSYIVRLESEPLVPPDLSWDRQWRLPSGALQLSVARRGAAHFLRFPGLADFLVDEGGGLIRCGPDPAAPLHMVRHLILDQVLPRIVFHSGRLVVHASAVADEQGVVVFLGQPGSGKSTLAASFHQRGFGLLTDDCLLLEESDGWFRGIPAYPGVRLWADSAEALLPEVEVQDGDGDQGWKKRLRTAAPPDQSPPVRALFVLGTPEEMEVAQAVSVEPVKGAAALTELIRHGFPLDTSDHRSVEEQFVESGAVLRAMPLFRLTYPRGHDWLPEVREAICASWRAAVDTR